MTQFPYWLLLGDGDKRAQSHHPGWHHVALRVSQQVPPGLRLCGSGSRLAGPQWVSLHRHHVSSLYAQGASIPPGGWPCPGLQTRSLPNPGTHPPWAGASGQSAGPTRAYSLTWHHRWPVLSCAEASQVTVNPAASRAQPFAAKHCQVLAQERLMASRSSCINNYFTPMVIITKQAILVRGIKGPPEHGSSLRVRWQEEPGGHRMYRMCAGHGSGVGSRFKSCSVPYRPLPYPSLSLSPAKWA